MKRKNKGSTTVALGVFLLSGVLTSILGLRQFDRFNNEEIWAMAGDWSRGVVVQPQMLRKIKVAKDSGGVEDRRQLLGKQLLKAKKDGEVVKPSELGAPKKSWLSQQVPDSKVLYTLKPRQGSIPHSQLNRGDQFDVLVSGRYGVRTVAHNARLIGVLNNQSASQKSKGGLGALALPALRKKGSPGDSLVIAVAPEEVYPLANIGDNEKVSIVLHSALSDGSHARPVIVPKPVKRTIELISGMKRSMVNVKM